MNINAILERVFKNFTFDDVEIPISPNIYNGEASTYLTYYTYNTKPEGFADDLPIVEGTYGTLDIYSNKNYITSCNCELFIPNIKHSCVGIYVAF